MARDTTANQLQIWLHKFLQGLMKIIVHRIYPINLGQNSAYIRRDSGYADEDHVVVTNKGNQTSVYINNELVQTKRTSTAETYNPGTNPKMYLGKNFQGQLRDVRYYTKELSMEEVEGLYNGGVLGTEKLYAPLTYENDKFKVFSDHPWTLSTEISQGDPINNPWTGLGETGSPTVLAPLHTLSEYTVTVSDFGNFSGIYNWDNSTKRWYKSGTTTYFAQYGSTPENTRIPDTVPTGPNAYRPNGGFSGDRVGRWFGFADGATDYMYWSHNKPVELGYDEKVGFLYIIGGSGGMYTNMTINYGTDTGRDLEVKIEWDTNLVNKVRIENNLSENSHSSWATVQLADIKVFDEDNTNQISPSSTITQSDNSYGDDSSNAIDGDLNTYNSNGESVISSGKWVEVTLNKPSRVSVVITNRANHHGGSASHAVPTRIKFLNVVIKKLKHFVFMCGQRKNKLLHMILIL